MTFFMIKGQTNYLHTFSTELNHLLNDILASIDSSTVSKHFILLIDWQFNNDSFLDKLSGKMIE